MAHLTVHQPTDTARPYPVLPIYFIHRIDQPFCSLPGCWCRSCQQEVSALLAGIETGRLEHQPATDFAHQSPAGEDGNA